MKVWYHKEDIVSRFDQLNISHDADDISGAAATHYGSDIPLKSIPDNVGNFDAVAHFEELPNTGNITVNLYGGAAASPTTVTQTLFTGTAAALATALRNGELSIGITPGALKAYNRFGVISSATLSAGIVTTAIVPAGKMMK
jgi:hypothetical protein